MSIAEQLTQTMEPLLDAVYAAGKSAGGGTTDNPLKYISPDISFDGFFDGAKFPENFELVFERDTCSANLGSMFRNTINLRKLTLDIPKDSNGAAYNAYYFIYCQSTTNDRTLKELVIPEEMKISNASRFVAYRNGLVSITGSIDATDCTNFTNAFANCSNLRNIRFKANTISKSIDFLSSSSLTPESAQSIIDGLAQNTGDTQLTLTLNKHVSLTTEQSVAITAKNWTLVTND